jgi:putative hydrolase of the HAD superfamily
MLQAITFDVGGTLIRPWPSVGHVYAEVAAQHGLTGIPPETLNHQFAAAWQAKRNFDHSRSGWLDLVQKTFAGSVAEDSVGGFFADLYARFGQPEAWHVFDDVFPALEMLSRRGLKLGIISNWDERLRPLLTKLTLAPWFRAIVISVEAGFTKPSREIFGQTASSLGVPPGSILHVGDSATEDVRGAQAAGLRALLLDRKGSTPPPPSISTLAGLQTVLGES